MTTTFNKFLATATTAAIVTTAIVPAASAEKVHSFTDLNKNYDEAVSFLYSNGIIKGKTNTTFVPNANLTRGDAAVILAGALGLDTENAKDAGFKDLNSRIKGSVNALAEAKIIASNTDKFNPNELLSRGAMAKLLVLGFELQGFETETPFNDATGAFAPYIEALYGTEITYGKTPTSFGTNLNITRGDFANLLYRTFNFVIENSGPFAKSVEFTSATSFKIVFEEAFPADVTTEDVVDSTILGIVLEDGTEIIPDPTSLAFSEDRTTLIVTHNQDLTGKVGTIYVDFISQPFEFVAPVAGAGTINLEGTDPVSFDFAGKNTVDVVLPATAGIANLNGMVMNVTDTFAANATVTVLLKDTNVPAAQGGIGQTWGTLQYKDSKWELVDDAKYDVIPAGTYVLEAPFKDAANNTTTLTLNVEVK
jgi:hypothetical protein